MTPRTRAALQLLAENLRRIRLERHVTQEELAERAGYDTRMIQYLESAQRNVTVECLAAIADALGVGMEELFAAESVSGARHPTRAHRKCK